MKTASYFSSRYLSQIGFTLVELLVVMAIIGILVALGGGSFISSQQKSRDTQRKSDLKQIGIALETYYNDKGQYPLGSTDGRIEGCGAAVACTWGEPFVDDNDTLYMVALPDDPQNNRDYFYVSDGTYYQIYAKLENNRDFDIPKDTNDDPLEYSGLDCGIANCDYGVASPNALPADGQTLVNQ